MSTIESEYDFKNARKNPYAEKLKKQVNININIDVTIDVDNEVLEFFETQSNETGIPCQKLIALYLEDCAINNKILPTTNIGQL